MNPGSIVRVLEELLPAVGYRVEPVLKFLGEKGLPKQMAGFAETQAQTLAAKGLGGGTTAQLRVLTERLIDKGALPSLAAPKTGVFDLVQPTLPADTPKRLLGMPKKFFNPAYVGEHVFGAAANPAIDTAEAAEKVLINSHGFLKSLRPLVKNLKNPAKDKEFVSDMSDGYTRAFPHIERIEQLTKQLADLERGPAVQFAPIGQVAPAVANKEQLLGELAKAQQAADAIRTPLLQKWAGRSGSVRVMLASEPSAHPWVLPMMHPEERKAAEAVRRMLDTIGKRAGELGIPVIENEYTPHFMGRLLDNIRKVNPAIVERSRVFQLPDELKWAQRSPASKQWWPVVQELQHYIPDAHRRLAFTPVLRKWKPILEGFEKKGYGGVSNYFKNYLDDLAHGDQYGKLDKWTEALVGFEYLGKVGFSPSTAFKHVWKATRLLAMHPVAAVKTAPQLLNVARGMLARGGGEPGAAYRLTSQMLQARALFHGFSGIDANRGLAGHMLGLVASSPIMAVEAGERALAILATMQKGMARELPLRTIQQQMYHTMLNVSFMGQIDRYPWLKTPLQRLAFLFYYTPMRISETTAKWALYSVWPSKFMDATRTGFWSELASGSRKFRTDPFGETYGKHLARNLLVVGGAAGLASAYTGMDPVSLAKIAMMHLPMERETVRGHEIVPPAIADIPIQMNQLGGISLKSFEHALLNHYSIYAGSTLMRLLQQDIPKMYYGGPMSAEFYYTLKIPPADTKHYMQAEYQRRNSKQLAKRYQQMDKNERYNVFAQFASWLKKLATGQ